MCDVGYTLSTLFAHLHFYTSVLLHFYNETPILNLNPNFESVEAPAS
jgi:hypothetical protein